MYTDSFMPRRLASAVTTSNSARENATETMARADVLG
jgi:hypothetical protein